MINEEQIWSYFDGQFTEDEAKELERVIATDTDKKALFEEIAALNNTLKSGALLLSPSVSFTDSVMAQIQTVPAYTPVQKLSFKPFLIVVLPTLLVIAVFALILAYKQVPLSYSLPVGFKSLQLYFLVIDVLLLAYFVDRLSEYRFNRKTLFAQ